MTNLTLISCSYNTPDVTITMLRSFFTHHGETSVLIIDNSSNDDTAMLLDEYKIPYLRNVNGLHIKSIDPLIEQVQTKYALLVDTDIIFLKNHEHIFEQFVNADLTLLGDICGDRGGMRIHHRVHPWYCFINCENIKKYNIKFYNPEKQFSKSEKAYDVGCTFFEDVRSHKLKIGDIKLENDYYKHYEGMSWRTKRFGPSDGDIDHNPQATHNNIAYYNQGKYIEQLYLAEIPKYQNTPILCKP